MSSSYPASSHPVGIVGGGIAGLAIGWQLQRAGVPCIIFEAKKTGRATSWLAAGMLAPDAEIEFHEQQLHALSLESRSRWPEFARELQEDSGMDVDFRKEGTLLVADDRDSASALRRRYEFQEEHGCRVEWLSGEEVLEREPFLAPRLSAAVFAPDDYQVENRLVVQALAKAFGHHGGSILEDTPIAAIHPDDEEPVVTTQKGERYTCSKVVCAAGTGMNDIEGIMLDMPPIRPVKGQMIELEAELPFDLQHVVRGPDSYIVPKSNGRLLIGATSEERGFDTDVTGGGLYDLLEGAWEVVPGIHDLPFRDAWAGLRPASFDHKPLLGPGAEPGILYAAGLYRHGILLTPVVAREVARCIIDGETSDRIEPFVPTRFINA